VFLQKKVKTKDRVELVDITKKVKKLVEDQSIKSGILVINIPHTTAGVTINENADPSVKKDIVNELNKVIPFNDNYNHLEGNSAAHIKSSIFGSDQIIIIENGKLQLGRWQGIFFCEFDGPRNRKMNFKIIES